MTAADYNLFVPLNLLTTIVAAEKLGVSQRRVIAMITAGRLKAEKLGNTYLIKPADLEKVKDRKVGRPRRID